MWPRIGLAVGVVSLAACAPTQVIPIRVEPQPVVLYLDGVAVEGPTDSLELKANRDHTLFFRRDGYRPELVVLQTAEVEGERVLIPDRVELELQQVRDSHPSLELEFEDED